MPTSTTTDAMAWKIFPHTVDLENFGVKILCKAHTSTKLKQEIFYYDNFTFE